MEPPLELRLITRVELARMVEQGMFEDERVELLRGQLFVMSPLSPEHCYSVDELAAMLIPALAGRARVRVQQPLALADVSQPQPDLSVVAPDDYRHAHPTTACLVIEVAATSVRRDIETKATVYAEAGIPEYWVVDLARDVVVRFLAPADHVYTSVTEHGRNDRIALQSFPDVEVPVAAVLP